MKKVCCLLTVLITLSSAAQTNEKEHNKIKENKQQKFSRSVKLAQENDPEALYDLGKFYYEGKIVKRNYKKALEYLQKAHDLGYEKATYNMGILYSNRKTPYHSYSKAYNIFIELAEKGHAAAQNRVGMFLTLGMGGPIDFKEAVKWYEKSSQQGYITAQCNLASMYAEGMGVFTNFGRAHTFAKKGKELQNPICIRVWKDYNLGKYNKDKGFKFKFYTQP